MGISTLKIGKRTIQDRGQAFVIAEIGHNHQGDLEKAKRLIEAAASCGADAVKFQKRFNRSLYTRAMFDKPYDNENSFGTTYGEHREFLEFGSGQFKELMIFAREHNVEFMCTAFDQESVDFLEDLNVGSYKFASGDITNIPLLEYAAQHKKPMFISTGAATLKEVRFAYEAVRPYTDQICLLHTTCIYPADYPELQLRVIETLKKEFPDVIIGYSGHDNGIVAGVIAYMLGATVIEKHFTLNHSWKGTDHNFSLEPEGLRKQVRDLRRIDLALGDGEKRILSSEVSAKKKMGKSLYAARALTQGHVLTREDIAIKSPAEGLPPYEIKKIIGRRLRTAIPAEKCFSLEDFS